MTWLEWLLGPSGAEYELQAAREIAVLGRREVVLRILPRVNSLPRAQARGYIRAKSTPVLSPLIERAIHRDDRLVCERSHALLELAQDEMVHLVLDELARAALRERYRKAAA